MCVSVLVAGDTEINETRFISIGLRLVNKCEADEEGMPEDGKGGTLGRENCRSREGSTLERPLGRPYAVFDSFICSCFSLSSKVKEIYLTRFNIQSINFT